MGELLSSENSLLGGLMVLRLDTGEVREFLIADILEFQRVKGAQNE